MAKMRIVVYAFQKINKNKCKLKLKDKDNRIQKLRECDLNKDFHWLLEINQLHQSIRPWDGKI